MPSGSLRTGIPRPVHLDYPGDVTGSRFKDPSELRYYYDTSKYRTESKPHLRKLVELIRKAHRPMIVASRGVFYSRAWDALKQVAEKADIAVVESGLFQENVRYRKIGEALGARGEYVTRS